MKLRYISILLICVSWIVFTDQTKAQGTQYYQNFNQSIDQSGWMVKNNTYPLTAEDGDWSTGGSREGFIGGDVDNSSMPSFLTNFVDVGLSASGLLSTFTGQFATYNYRYACAGYTEQDYDGAHISKWLFSPVLFNIKNGDIIKFQTRERLIDPSNRIMSLLAKDPNGVLDCNRPNRLEVRLSITGNSSNTIAPNVGSSPTSVGDFTYKLLDINPTLTPGGYPTGWTQYTIVISGLPNGQLFNGRIGFWYHYENGGYNNCRSRLQLPDHINTPLSLAGDLPGPIGEVTGAAGDVVSVFQGLDALSSKNQKGTNGTFVAVDNFEYIPTEVLSLREDGTNNITYQGYGSPATQMGYQVSPSCPIAGKKTIAKYRMWNKTNAPITFYAGIESGYPAPGERAEWDKYELSPSGEFITLGAGQSMQFTVKLKSGLSTNTNPNIPGKAYLMIKQYTQNGPELLSYELNSTILPLQPPVAKCTTNPIILTLNDSGYAVLTNAKAYDNGSTIGCGDASELNFSFAQFWNGYQASGTKTFSCGDIGTQTWYLRVKHPSVQTASTCPLSVTIKRNDNSNDLIYTQDTNIYLTTQQKSYPFTQNSLKQPKFKGPCSSYAKVYALHKGWTDSTNYLLYPSLSVGFYVAYWEISRTIDGPVERTLITTFNVLDTIKPHAACSLTDTVKIGFDQVWIAGTRPQQWKLRDAIWASRDVGVGSTDNVGIQRYGIYSPWYSNVVFYEDSFVINCNNIGAVFPVTLKVWDYSNNSSTCQTVVKILDPSKTMQCKNTTITLDPITGTKNITANELLLNGASGACGITNVTLSKFNFNCSNKNQTIPVTVGYTGSDSVIRGCVSNVTVKEQTMNCVDTVKSYLTNYSVYPFDRVELQPLLKSPCSAQAPWSLSVGSNYFPSISGTKTWDFKPGFTEITRKSIILNDTFTCKQVYAVYDNDPPKLLTTHANDSFIYPMLKACSLPYEIINQFQQGTYDTWSYTLSGATNKTVVIDPKDYKYFNTYWLNQWDTLNPGITTVKLTAFDLGGNRTTVSYTVKVVLGEVGPYVGLPLKPGVPIIDTLIQGDFCGATYNFYVQSPVLADCGQKDYMWYYQIRDGYQGNILYELDSIPQIAGADIPVKIGPKYNQNYLQYIYFGYHDKTYGLKTLSGYSTITVRDTVLRVVVPEDTTVQSLNDSTFTYNYTIPSPIKYQGSCVGGYWGYSVSGATNLKSVVNPAIVYNGNQIWAITNSDYSKGYPSVPADSTLTVKLNLGKNTIEYYVLEANGNGRSTSPLTYKYTVTVEDVSTPVMICPPSDTIYRSSGSCKILTKGPVAQVNGFTGAYGKTKLNKFGDNSQIKLNKSTAPDSVSFFLDGSSSFISYSDAYLILVFNTSGTVSFNWDYECNSPSFFRPFITFNNFNPSAATKPLPSGFNLNNTGFQTGTFTRTVSAGDVLRIGLNEGGGSNVIGYFNIKNFSAPNASTISSLAQPTFADNAALYFSSDMQAEYPIGNNTIHYSLKNLNNNKTTTCTQTLTVIDNFARSLSCANDTLYLGYLGEANLNIDSVLSTSCFPVSSTKLSKKTFTGNDIGTQNVSVTSISLNDTLTCNFLVTVKDTLPPSANNFKITLPLSNANTATLNSAMIKNFFYDNHKVVSATASKTTFTCDDIGSQTISATATDSSGNSATISVTIEVTPGFAPITPPSTKTVSTCSKDSVKLSYETDSSYSLAYQWQVKEKVDSIKHWNFYTSALTTPLISGTYVHRVFKFNNETYAAYGIYNGSATVGFRKLDTISNNWRPALAPLNDYIYNMAPTAFRVYVVPGYTDNLFVAYIDNSSNKFVVKKYQPYTNSWYTCQDLGGVTTTLGDTTGAIDYFSYPTSTIVLHNVSTKNQLMSEMYGNEGIFFLTRQQPNSGGYDVFCVSIDTAGNFPFSYKYNTGDTVWSMGQPFPVKQFNIARGATTVNTIANGKKILAVRYNQESFNRFFELIRTPSYYGYVIVTGRDSLTNDPTGGSSLFAIKDFNNKDYIAYKSANGKICVKQYNGTNSWSNVGALDFSSNEVTKLNLGIVKNELYVVYVEVSGKMVIQKLENNAWKLIGSPNDDITIGSVGSEELNIVDLNNKLSVYYSIVGQSGGRLIRLDEWKTISGATSKTYYPTVSAGSVSEYRCIANSSCIFTPSQTQKVVVTKTPTIAMLTKQANVVKRGTAQLLASADSATITWKSAFTQGAQIVASGANFTLPNLKTDTTLFAFANIGDCYSDTVSAKVYVLDSLAAPFKIDILDTICSARYVGMTIDSGAQLNYKYTLYAKDSAGIYQPTDNYIIHSTPDPGDEDEPYVMGVYVDKTTDFKIRVQENFKDAANAGYILKFPNTTLPITNQLTVEAWVLPTSTDPSLVMDNRYADNAYWGDRNWEWRNGSFNVVNKPQLIGSNWTSPTWRSLAFPTLPAYYEWVHIATTADSSGLKIYYNGVLVASNTASAVTAINNNVGDISVGTGNSGFNSTRMRGVDEFRVWNTVRNAAQIQTTKDICLTGTESGLVLYNNFSNYNDSTATFPSLTGPNSVLEYPAPKPTAQIERNGSCLTGGQDFFTAPFTVTMVTDQPILTYYDEEHDPSPSQCFGETVELVAHASSGGVTWYNAFEGGQVVGTGDTLRMFIDKDTMLYPMASNSVCERGETRVRVNTPPVVYTAIVDRYCYGQSVDYNYFDVDYDGDDYKLYHTATGGTPIDWDLYKDSALTKSDTLWVEAYKSDWVQQPNSSWQEVIICVSVSRIPLILNVTPKPAVVTKLDSSRYESGSLTLVARPGVNELVQWFDINENYLGDYDSTFTTPNLTSTTKYLLRAIDFENHCQSDVYDTITATINHYPSRTDTVIACESFTWVDGNTYTVTDSTISYLKHNTIGVDSLIHLNLTIIGFENTEIIADKMSMCSGDSTFITIQSAQMDYHYTLVDSTTNVVVRGPVLGTGGDIVFNTGALTQSKVYKIMATDTAMVSNYTLGCTKQIGAIMNLRVGKLYGSMDVATCGSYSLRGKTYTQSGIYYDSLPSTQGCDSVIQLNISILPVKEVVDTIVACSSYTWYGVTYTSSTSTPTRLLGLTEFGCDSIARLFLTINNTTATDNRLAWDSYTWINGVTYTSNNNTAQYTIANAKGCDSLITLNLTILNSAARTWYRSVSICSGGSSTFNGNTYTTTGNYRDTLVSSTGRKDSIIVTQLTVNAVYSINNPQTTCNGNSYSFNGHTYTTSGIYRDTLHTVTGCDSIIVTQLTVNPLYSISNPQTICSGNSYVLNGHTYTTAGTYRDTLHTVTGCDSIIVTQLNVNPTFSVNNPKVICNGNSYSLNGHTYTIAGTYRDTLHTVTGCDSIIVTQLTVNPKPLTSAITGDINPALGSTRTYSVINTTGSVYNWTITNGTQVSGGTSNSISVLWGNAIVTSAVKVVETNVNGCKGDSVTQTVALPVKLLSFTGRKKDRMVELNWVTSSEVNNRGFDVERSFDETNFEPIGFVKGRGTTNQTSRYQLNDTIVNVHASIIYYRLKQMDFNGDHTYSSLVAIVNATKNIDGVKLEAIPNPFKSVFDVNISSKQDAEAILEVYDSYGKRVATQKVHLSAGDKTINFEGSYEWRSGMYFIVLWKDDERQTIRIVKE